MKLKRVKKILLLVIVASIFSISNVKAALPECTTVYPKKDAIATAFNFTIDEDNSKNFIIRANPKTDDTNLLKAMKKVKFQVVSVDPADGNNSLIGLEMTPGTTLKFQVNGRKDLEIGPGVEIVLRAMNLEGAGICKGGGDVVLQEADYNNETIHEDGELDGGGTISIEAGKEIKCNESHAAGSFEEKFCIAKLGAEKLNGKINGQRTYYAGDNSFTKNSDMSSFDALYSNPLKFKCDVNWGGSINGTKFKIKNIDEALKYINNPEEGYYFDENTTYLYGEGEKVVNKGAYKFHYHSHHATEGKEITCKVKCEEAVTIQYGPPVAGKAGMCFDYQIKVESRLNCHVIDEVDAPPTKYSVCTPHPTCHSKSGHVYNQGGPNEDFAECVNTCDGGKYTDKCTKGCYQAVYKDSSNPDNVNLIDPTMRKTSNEDCSLNDLRCWFNVSKAGNAAKNSKYDGAYVQDGGSVLWLQHLTLNSSGSIKKPVAYEDWNTKGRWYFHHSWGFPHPYPVTKNGIPRSAHCTDSCWWKHNCGSNEYLNWGLAKKDYDANYELYKKAVEECNAMSKCQTSTSTYTISATYNQKGGSEKTLTFPSDDGITDLQTCEVNKANEINASATNAYNVVKRFDGCYKAEGCKYNNENYPTAGKYYMSEWTFPGSYTNKKTGEISYDPKYANDSKWRTRKRKFCLPRDAEPVNSFWYYWYFATHEGYTYAQDNCLTPKVKEFIRTTEDKYDESKTDAGIKWNINGNTRKFGYFLWNIDVSCFYAVDDGTDATTTVTTNDDPTAEVNCRNTEYRVRTVTNTELFPSSSSEETAGGTTAGREAGFNWTKNATLHAGDVGEAFANDPTQVKNYIETMKNEIYSSSDKYVDYQFKLTPQVISEIKNYNSKVKSYDTYCGNMVEVKNPTTGKVVFFAYESNLFRPSVAVDATACPTALNSVNINTERVGNILCNNDAANHTDCNTTYQP